MLSRFIRDLLICSAIATTCFGFHEDVELLLPDDDTEYKGIVNEGQDTVIITPPLQVVPETGRICSYELQRSSRRSEDTSTLPFIVSVLNEDSGEAEVRVRPGVQICSGAKSFDLLIAAKRCEDGALSENAALHIVVNCDAKKPCIVGWKNLSDKIEYIPRSGISVFANQAHLEMCDLECEIEKIESTVILQTQHISRGCDRDTYDARSQRSVCGAHASTVDLLPKNETATEEADDVYFFDGETSAYDVSSLINTHTQDKMTVSFWMKHDALTSTGLKENILCYSDSEKLNRHHFAAYVKNCKLEFLLRHPSEKHEEDSFLPTEWRWTLPSVCDGHWHHYAISVSLPQVQLFVDGEHFVASDRNPDVLDDYPMQHALNTNGKMVVGACWHGAAGHMAQYFKGYLSSLTFLSGVAEKHEVFSCVHSCGEKLGSPQNEAILNKDSNRLLLRSHTVKTLEDMLRKITYENTLYYPTPGHRPLSIETSLKCKHLPDPIELQSVKTLIVVLRAPDPVLSIRAPESISVKQSELTEHGVRLFDGVRIFLQSEGKASRYNEITQCEITAEPALNKEHEFFSASTDLIAQRGLQLDTQEGLLIKGVASDKEYSDLIGAVRYFNRRPTYFNKRVFSLVCHHRHTRTVESRLTLTVTITPDETTTTSPTPSELLQKVDHVPEEHEHQSHKSWHRLDQLESGGFDLIKHSSGSSAGVVIILAIIACVAIIALLLIVGVWRVRAGRTRKDRDEMNITVNPIEHRTREEESEESDHDEYEFTDEDDEEEEEKGLEWDEAIEREHDARLKMIRV